jgi:hypothetical protein
MPTTPRRKKNFAPHLMLFFRKQCHFKRFQMTGLYLSRCFNPVVSKNIEFI